MDQNEALKGQGAANANPQGDQPNNNNQTMESLLESESLSVELPQVGEIRKGVIASLSASQILVSIGAKSEGIISGRELDQLTEEERNALQVGQEVNVYVVNPEDGTAEGRWDEGRFVWSQGRVPPLRPHKTFPSPCPFVLPS